jgi:hypothetical protein
MCAFCGKIADTATADSCAMVVVTNWRGFRAEGSEHRFFAHTNCLVSRMHDDVAADWALSPHDPLA